MRARIEATRKHLAAEAALPEEKRWDMEEQHLEVLEDGAVAGDDQAAQFLVMARERMAALRRERFEKAWGRLLNHPDAVAELEAHAQRVAALKRIRYLAHGRRSPALEQRARELIKTEWDRHEKHMQAIAADLKAPVAAREAAEGAP